MLDFLKPKKLLLTLTHKGKSPNKICIYKKGELFFSKISSCEEDALYFEQEASYITTFITLTHPQHLEFVDLYANPKDWSVTLPKEVT